MAYVGTVRTASGAMAVQIVWSARGGHLELEHIGSGHDAAEVEALRSALIEASQVIELPSAGAPPP